VPGAGPIAEPIRRGSAAELLASRGLQTTPAILGWLAKMTDDSKECSSIKQYREYARYENGPLVARTMERYCADRRVQDRRDAVVSVVESPMSNLRLDLLEITGQRINLFFYATTANCATHANARHERSLPSRSTVE